MDEIRTTKRKEWIDISKGIGIILVVMGHCFVKDTIIHNWIFSFHMPLFFILSGYCFNPDKYTGVKSVMGARFKALIIPYIIFALIGAAISAAIPAWRSAYSVKSVLKDIYQGYPSLTHITSIWYLISLYIITVVFYIAYHITKKLDKRAVLYAFIALSGLFGWLITIVKELLDKGEGAGTGGGFKMPGDRLPLTIDASMTALVFFALGALAFTNIEKLKDKNTICVGAVCMLINIVFGSVLNTRVNIHGCTYGNVLYFYIAAVAGTLSVIFFGMWLENKKRKWIRLVKRILIFYGKNSLFMFAMQSLFINLFFLCINSITGSDYIIFEVLPNRYAVIAFVLIMLLLPVSFMIYKKAVNLPDKLRGKKG